MKTIKLKNWWRLTHQIQLHQMRMKYLLMKMDVAMTHPFPILSMKLTKFKVKTLLLDLQAKLEEEKKMKLKKSK
jgi:hypothetical protein